jgi:hypothetical protein
MQLRSRLEDHERMHKTLPLSIASMSSSVSHAESEPLPLTALMLRKDFHLGTRPAPFDQFSAIERHRGTNMIDGIPTSMCTGRTLSQGGKHHRPRHHARLVMEKPDQPTAEVVERRSTYWTATVF